jgi:hypothetical protein
LEQNLKETREKVNDKAMEELGRIKEMENELNQRQMAMMREIEDKCKLLNNLKTIVRDKMNEN